MRAILYETMGGFFIKSLLNYGYDEIMDGIDINSRYYIIDKDCNFVSNNPIPPSQFDHFCVYWPDILDVNLIQIKT